jgi:anti-sigma B factor antagonist
MCEVAEVGTCLQITAGGELDLAAAPLMRAAAERATFVPGRVILLDLTSVSFVDSSVAHFALDLDRRALACGGELVIIATPEAKALFELVGADGLTIVEE